MSHPSGGDPQGDAAMARVNAIRAARGLPPIVERDPAAVRRSLLGDRDAMMVAVAVLHRPGCGATVPDAIDAALVGKPPVAAYDVPPGVALAILARTPDEHTPAMFDALDAELERFAAVCAADPVHVRELAHLAVDRLHAASRSAIVDSIADGLAGAVDHGGRPFTDEQIAQAARTTTDTVTLPAIVERLREHLLSMAGLP